MSRSTIARISTPALRHNLSVVAALAPGCRIVSVVKADGYGHGIDTVARALKNSDLLAVATVGELHAVRQSGWKGRLLALEGFNGAEEYEELRALKAEFVVHHDSQVECLRTRGGMEERQAWLKLDTGMHRLGFSADRAPALFDELARLTSRVPVLMSHFACADEPLNPMTATQMERFDESVKGLEAEQSLANSAGVLVHPESRRGFVRPGVMLYGISPLSGDTGRANNLQPVMTLECRLLAINACRRGDTVGYGARFTCPHDMPVGVAGIGYGDGYPRGMRDGAPVLVNGQKASLAGRVSMDMITLDLRGHDNAKVGDKVTLWGEGLPVETVAPWADTIPYELICGVTGRVRREVS